MTDQSSRMPPQPEPTTPPDFPRVHLGTVPGVQPKLLAVKVGGEYTLGMSEAQLYARYDVCFDLVNQLQTYSFRKLKEHPDWTTDTYLQKLRLGVLRRADWDCTAAEFQWVLKQLCIRMDWPLVVDESKGEEFRSLCPEYATTDQRLIDRMLGNRYGVDGSLLPPERAPMTMVEDVMRRLGTRRET